MQLLKFNISKPLIFKYSNLTTQKNVMRFFVVEIIFFVSVKYIEYIVQIFSLKIFSKTFFFEELLDEIPLRRMTRLG